MSSDDIERLKQGKDVYTGADRQGDAAAERLVREAREAGVDAAHVKGRRVSPGQEHRVEPR